VSDEIIKCPPCEECPDEGLPGWMGTFADMMTLLFAFFVLMFSMATLDPVKYSAMQDVEADRKGGATSGSSAEDTEAKIEEIKENMAKLKEQDVTEINGIPIQKYEEILIEDAKEEESKTKKSLAEIKETMENILVDMNILDSANVVTDPRGVILELDGDVCFSSGKVEMNDKLIAFLEDASKQIMQADNDQRPIIVEGHTDNVVPKGKVQKKFPSNWELSTARASTVVNFLISKGVNPSRLSARGYASRWPAGVLWNEIRNGSITDSKIAEMNKTPELQAKNRRIKIIVGDASYQ